MFGNGKKVGAVKPWQIRDLVELEEQHTDIAIDYTVQPYMRTLWTNFQHLKL